MRAALLEQQGKPIQVYDNIDIIAPRAGEVRVKVSHCGVCHSDLTMLSEGYTPTDPIILGHEASGVIESVGAGVTWPRVGDHVVLTPVPPCGFCDFCQKSDYHLCINAQDVMTNTFTDGTTGLSRGSEKVLRGLGVGAFAEMVVTKASGAVVIPSDLPLDTACIIGCALQTGVGAVLNTGQMRPSSSALIFGLGGVGIAAVQGARIAGGSTIIAVDPVEERRQHALEMGAHHVFDPNQDDIVDVCRSLTKGYGVDYAFDCVGSTKVVSTAFEATCNGATIVCVGAPHITEAITIDPAVLFVTSGKKLYGCMLGSCNSPRDIPLLAKFWQSGQLHLDPMITKRRPLEDINQAFDDLNAAKGVRSVIQIH